MSLTYCMMPLKKGKFFAQIDIEDYNWLNSYKWYCSPNGYAICRITSDGWAKNIPMHRMIMQDPKGIMVDHIDGNGLNNRRENLRLATAVENGRNKRISVNHSKRKSNYKGVHYFKRDNKWKAAIWTGGQRRIGGKCIHLGFFWTEKEAAIAYNEAATKYHGEFANLNKISDFPDPIQRSLDFDPMENKNFQQLPKVSNSFIKNQKKEGYTKPYTEGYTNQAEKASSGCRKLPTNYNIDPDGLNSQIRGQYATLLKEDPLFLQARTWGVHPAVLTMAIQRLGIEWTRQQVRFVMNLLEASPEKIKKPAGYLTHILKNNPY